MEKIWEDFSGDRRVGTIGFSVFCIFFLILLLFFSSKEYIRENQSIVWIMPTITFSFLIVFNRIDYFKMTKDGVTLGEPFFKWKSLFFLNSREFVRWRDIKKIYSVERQKKMGNFIVLVYLLNIETNTGSKKSIIMATKSFENALKQLHKENFLIKDHKYSKIRDSDISDLERERLIEKLEMKEKIL